MAGRVQAMKRTHFTVPYMEEFMLSGGGHNFTGDYSSAVNYAELRTGSGLVCLTEFKVFLSDATALQSGGYGAMAALTNGITMQHVVGTGASAVTKQTLINGDHVVKTNADWLYYCDDDSPSQFGGGDNYLAYVWHFHHFCDGILVDFDAGETIQVTLNDSFIGLTSHHMRFWGYQVKDYQR